MEELTEVGAVIRQMQSRVNGLRLTTDGTTSIKERLAQEKREQAEKELTERIQRANIPRRYRNVTFSWIEKLGLPMDKNIRYNYGMVKKFAENLQENIDNGNGLILAGSPGTMKTTMAIAVLREYIEQGRSGMFVPMPSLIDNLFTLRATNRQEEQHFVERIHKSKLLVLDDLGGENFQQEWIMAKVDSIVTNRYNDMLSTIVTTNFFAKELQKTYAGRIMDRFRSTSQYLEFVGKSQRKAVI